jgi:hypothetical protein
VILRKILVSLNLKPTNDNFPTDFLVNPQWGKENMLYSGRSFGFKYAETTFHSVFARASRHGWRRFSKRQQW